MSTKSNGQHRGEDKGADAWGISDGYRDALGVWRPTTAETRRALLAAMGERPTSRGPSQQGHVRVVRPGHSMRLAGPAELRLEDGTTLRVERQLPPDLPLGYHALHPLDGGPAVRIIASPARCYLPEGLCAWGWAVQLYALRSSSSWGMGDLADLRRLAHWSAADLGAGIIVVNPLGAAMPMLPQQPSPYYPSSRRYRNPLYLSIEAIPGASAAPLDLEPLAAAGRALNSQRRIDRDAVFRLKMEALDQLWRHFGGNAAFEGYCAMQGEPLRQFAIFCALAEHFGAGWPGWPAEYRRPDSLAVERFAVEQASRVAFHRWVQWLLDEQLAAAAAEVPLLQDLPIGADPGGADAWAWQDVLAKDLDVGAPPDAFNTQGQNWGLPPFIPHKLRETGYEPFVQTIRATLRHAGGLRIDHVMGLFRLYWIPRGASPAEGAYVRYPAEDLLAIVALESHRARALVVGEDLGTVEEGVRERLAQQRILSYRVLVLEEHPPRSFPSLAVAAATTHDLPTIHGILAGADLRAQQALGLQPNQASMAAIAQRLRSMAGLGAEAPIEQVIVQVYRVLAHAPSIMVTATLEDALAVQERPNMPGTIDEWPNWSLALPASLETIERDPRAREVAEALRRA